jgi:hypothetical protein
MAFKEPCSLATRSSTIKCHSATPVLRQKGRVAWYATCFLKDRKKGRGLAGDANGEFTAKLINDTPSVEFSYVYTALVLPRPVLYFGRAGEFHMTDDEEIADALLRLYPRIFIEQVHEAGGWPVSFTFPEPATGTEREAFSLFIAALEHETGKKVNFTTQPGHA